MTSVAPHTAEAAIGDGGLDSPEAKRWLMLLGVPFIVGGALFAIAIGTNTMWMLAFACLFGPGAMILGFTYLGLSRDANSLE